MNALMDNDQEQTPFDNFAMEHPPVKPSLKTHDKSPPFDVSDDPVRQYMHEIGKIDLLDADDEFWLSSRMKAQDFVDELSLQIEPSNQDARNNLMLAIINDLLSLNKSIKTISRKAQVNLPDYRQVLTETYQLRQPGKLNKPSFLRNYFNLTFWTPENKQPELIKSIYRLYLCFYLLPEDLSVPLQNYLQENHKLPNTAFFYKNMPAEAALEENFLDIELHNGEASQILTQANLRLVVSVAKRYLNRGASFLDLIQEGNLGLLKAVQKFDPTLGFKFSTYATWWIRQSVNRYIAENVRTIRIPTHIHEALSRILRLQWNLTQKLGRAPSDEEIALESEYLDEASAKVIQQAIKQNIAIDPIYLVAWEEATEKVRNIIKVTEEPISLEKPINSEENSTLGDFIEDTDATEPLDEAAKEIMREHVRRSLSFLNVREREVLELRFGLLDGHEYTLEEISKKFNITRERVRQIESKALRKLRHPSHSTELRDFL